MAAGETDPATPADGRRDYRAWHRAYDDPASGLSWRLRVVQQYLRDALDRHRGPVDVLSVCSGDGRDLLGVLAERPDAGRVRAVLLELDPTIADDARRAAAAGGWTGVEVRTVDAGLSDAYRGAVPADVVLLVGIFGNITDADLERTVRSAPQLCRPGATLLWSRGRHADPAGRDGGNDRVRAWFADVGFTELDYATREVGDRPALGCLRYDGPPVPLVAGRTLFTFVR